MPIRKFNPGCGSELSEEGTVLGRLMAGSSGGTSQAWQAVKFPV